MTWSIIGRDPVTGCIGVAVASRFFAVGALVPHTTGACAIATQAFVNPLYGVDGLRLLQEGRSSVEIIANLTSADEGRAHRQLHLIDRDGRTASYTGNACIDWCGAVNGPQVSVAGNMLAGPEVVQETLKAYVDAQEDYASQDRDGDGVLEYAQKLISSEGAHDGLYWPAEQGDAEQSPAGPALADGDAFEKAKAGEGYHGYRYRILGGQGDNIAGGKYDYVINGNMIAGHGVVAWPVRYGITGVKTFLVNKNGIIYEADLGENTPEIASRIRTFNPNDEWDIVQE